MFDRFFGSRLRAAEQAMRSGALDEAHRLASAQDLRSEPRAAALLRDLAPKFVERAEHHLAADRFAEALVDLSKAQFGGVMLERINQLRENIRVLAEALQNKQRERKGRVEAARAHIQDGKLEQGRRTLEQASLTDDVARRMQLDLQRRMTESQQAYETVAQCIRAGQWHVAADALRKARGLQADHPESVSFEMQIVESLINQAKSALQSGHLIRAQHELAALGPLGHSLPERLEVEESMKAIRAAGRAFAMHQYAQAREELVRAGRRLNDPAWMKRTLTELRDLEDQLSNLRGGPLGEAASQAGAGNDANARPTPIEDTLPVQSRFIPAGIPVQPESTGRLLLLVDGGGSYLVLRKDRVTLGRAASASPADVPIFSDLAERHAEIARIEDDYFLFGAQDLEVDGVRARQHLLRDGARITLGRRTRLTFHLPSRRSPTAVLDVSDSSRLPNDVRRIVLFKNSAIIGHGPGSHMLCSAGGSELLLFERAGQLYVKGHRQNGHEGQLVQLGTPMLVADSQFVLKPWEDAAGTRVA